MMDWNSFLELDRQILAFFNGSDSLFIDGIAMTLTSGLTWIPLYLGLFYLVIKNNETMAQVALIVGCAALCLFLAFGLTDYIVKPLVARWRPTNDPIIKYTIDVVNNYRESKFGFFSAHAANTMSITVFFSLLVRNRKCTIVLLTWSLLMCWTRLYLGVHYPGDILCGMAWGATVGMFVYLLYKRVYFKISPKLNYVSTQYTATGYSLSDIDVLITLSMFVYCYIIIRGMLVMNL